MTKVSIVSLGCPRNQLDSEVIAGSLKRGGYKICSDDEEAQICIINTCAFIQSAREESVGKIMEAVALKKEGRLKHLVVCGCLPQLYKEKLAHALKEADLVLGTSDFPKLPALLKSIRSTRKRSLVSASPDYLYDESSPRLISTLPHYAYVKISEGCSNFCSYCIISRLRGIFRSRAINSITKEVSMLAHRRPALKEIDLIGQDTTLFGIDRYGKAVLPELLKRICALKNNVRWVRVLYTHPAHYSDELISVMRSEKKICKYLDLPVQHISDNILKSMNRHVTKRDVIRLIGTLRSRIPGLVLRTSIIVGFPGETEKSFGELLDFVRRTKFERLGAFIYSREEGTRASKLEKQVPEKVKKARFAALMELQRSISAKICKGYVGSMVDVLIDEKIEGEKEKYLGRTQGDAPEIDGTVYVTGKNIKVGQFYKVMIKDSLEYDLIGDKI